METEGNRRNFLAGMAGCGAAVAVSGCGGSTPSPTAPVSSDRASAPVETPERRFEETDEFYAWLDGALVSPGRITVRFDGPDRIGADSRFFKDYLAVARNAQEIYEAIINEDTETGRELLKQVFDEDLLDHRITETEYRTPSGDVIEGGTVILVLGIVFILATTTIAIAGIPQNRPFRIYIRLHPIGEFQMIVE